MKKVIIPLLTLMALLVLTFYALNKDNFDLYTEANHVLYNQVLDDKEATVYYYYQDTCGYCNSIKDQVTNMYLAAENTEGINVKLVDLKSTKNANGWATGDYNPDTADFTNPEDIKVSGTPAMIYVVDGEVVSYKVGSDVFDILEQVNTEHGLEVELDRSKYGE